MTNEKGRSRQILMAAVAFAFLVNVVFYFTYPLNIGQSDNPTFLGMISNGSSNLMHASGYAAIVRFVANPILNLTPLPILFDIKDTPNRYLDVVQFFQFLIHFVLFAISIFLCAKVFGRLAAIILALAWGCNVLFMGNVNATAPEWLQGHALVLSVLMHAYARSLTARKKVLVYCLAAGIFGAAYLIKPNTLIFAICPFAFLLFDKESWRFKSLQLCASIAIAMLVISAYAHTYHFKSTGTTKLNFDHAWVLTSCLPPEYIMSPPELLGMNTLRWAALVRVTPRDYFRAGAIRSIDYGPDEPEIRAQYKDRMDRIFQMPKEELVRFAKDTPLPEDYSQWSSAVPLYYYYGLEKTDALGMKVYLEALRYDPLLFLRRMKGGLQTFLIAGVNSSPTFPTFANPTGHTFLSPDFSASSFGRSKIVPRTDVNPYTLEYYNPRETVSFYGVKGIQAVSLFTSNSTLYLVLNLLALIGLFQLRSATERITALSLLAAFGGFVCASAILMGMRNKELVAITPAYFLFLSVSLPSAGQWAVLRLKGALLRLENWLEIHILKKNADL